MEKSYYLENILESHKEYPRTFLTSTKEELENLTIGDWVRVFFVLRFEPEDGCRAERMWLVISEIEEGAFKGTLTNKPVYIKDLKLGDEVAFSKEHIASVLVETGLDESKLAIITRKALELEEINWVVKSDELQDEADSGWQLFYGDETEEYLDDERNIEVIQLGEVLSFEPRLEEVFNSSEGVAFEWHQASTRFREVTEE